MKTARKLIWGGTGAGISLLALLTFATSISAQSRVLGRSFQIVELDGAYLGIEMGEVTADDVANLKLPAERGVIVRSVEKGSPAETAGLLVKDVILEFSGIPVLSTAQFGRLVREMPPGRKVDLVVSRDGKRLNLSATLARREAGARSSRVIVAPRGAESLEYRFDAPGQGAWGFRGPDGRYFEFRLPRIGQWVQSIEEKPRLGVTLQPLSDQMAEFLGVTGKKGALVTGTIDGTPAAGKLKAGDVIVGADGRTIDSPEQLTDIVRKKDAGGKLDLKVVRDKKETAISIEISGSGEKPKPRGYRL